MEQTTTFARPAAIVVAMLNGVRDISIAAHASPYDKPGLIDLEIGFGEAGVLDPAWMVEEWQATTLLRWIAESITVYCEGREAERSAEMIAS